jgi:hypothetical protein
VLASEMARRRRRDGYLEAGRADAWLGILPSWLSASH